jgi:hypothetical protein
MRTAPTLARTFFAVTFALLLAIRLLTPSGFMPAFDHGAVTIVVCPDGDLAGAAIDQHHQEHSKRFHQPCPYAPASGAGSIAVDTAPLMDVLMISAALLLGRTFLFLKPSRAYERPPLRGPPLPA